MADCHNLKRESSRVYQLLLDGKATSEEYVAALRSESRVIPGHDLNFRRGRVEDIEDMELPCTYDPGRHDGPDALLDVIQAELGSLPYDLYEANRQFADRIRRTVLGDARFHIGKARVALARLRFPHDPVAQQIEDELVAALEDTAWPDDV